MQLDRELRLKMRKFLQYDKFDEAIRRGDVGRACYYLEKLLPSYTLRELYERISSDKTRKALLTELKFFIDVQDVLTGIRNSVKK